MEIRLHGRGGQGGVTCAKILAGVYSRLGKSVQAFGDYAGERSGAPVRAFTRVSDDAVAARNKVYQPDHLLVLDPALLGDDTIAGLASGGTLLVNTPQPPEELAARFGAFRIATVDATEIARRNRIGTRSLVIVNTTIAGAFARAVGLPFELLEQAYDDLGLEKNLPAAREAFDAVRVRDANGRALPAARPATDPPPVLPLLAHREGRPTGLKTGSWRSQMPVYAKHLAPCVGNCPAGNDVVGFLQAMSTRGAEAAAEVLGRSTPLAGVCGRVCPAPCMDQCNRKEHDDAVNVRGVERWIADHAPVAAREARRNDAPRRVAVVGGGPAGLSAAYTLARAGHRVALYEGEKTLGGLLRTGIPTYRLPRETLDREVADVVRLGVEVHAGERLDRQRVEALARDHEAVILATGLQTMPRLDVPGAQLEGVEQGLDFLARVNRGEPMKLPGHVVVLGGGNTAMDCARSALRCGASRVTVAYRRGRAEMPAIAEEVEQAMEEGVWFLFRRAPVGFAGNGRVATLEMAEVELGPADADGRRRPVVTDRRERLACDRVLLALGQSADLSILPAGWTLRDWRAWSGDAPTNVWAAGDLATNDGTVAHAIGSGRRAAGLALRALDGTTEPFERPDRATAVTAAGIRFDHFDRWATAGTRHLPAAERTCHFGEIGLGLCDPDEARRCLSCGNCTRCDTCLLYCPEGIIHRTASGYTIDAAYCKGCGICVAECPRNAMEMRLP